MASTFADVNHLLRRAGFGGTESEIGALMAFDWPEVVDRVLDTSAAPSINLGVPLLDGSRRRWDEYIDITQLWVNRAATSPCPIQEKMTLFWHGHLCSGLNKVNDVKLLFDQNQLFRTQGLGSFESLLQAVAIQPAMLIYLDNAANEAGSPNENFARELMELFTLGVGHYSEDDVRASARAWTGYGTNDSKSGFEFHPGHHDSGTKTFFGSTKNWDGPGIIHEILTGSKKDQVARFITTKIWEFFCYAEPDDGLVADLAAVFSASNLNITALLRAVFLRPEFKSQQCRQGLVRSPFDFTVALMRRTDVDASVTHPEWSMGPMGQAPFEPPNVAGWKQNGGWITPSSIWGKRSCANGVRWHLYESTSLLANESLSQNQEVDAALALFGIFTVSGATRTHLLDFCQAEPASWARRAGLLILTPLTPEFQMA